MSKNTIISSFKKIPKGIILFAALFLATEFFLNIIRPQITTIFWNKFVSCEHTLMGMPRDFDYLLMGNSIQKTGIDPTQVSDDLLSLGLPGAKPLGYYLLLSRYLERHNPPREIFLSLDPEDVRATMIVILKYFVTWPEYRHLWNDLTWEERVHFPLKYWASLDERMMTVSLKSAYIMPNKMFKEALRRNHGYIPLPSDNLSIDEDYFAQTGNRPEKTISMDDRDRLYLDKFISLARSHNIKIILMGSVVPKELYEIQEKTGFNRQWREFLDFIKVRYPDTIIVKDPILVLDNKYFADMSHVNREGRAIYTSYFKNQVFIPFTGQKGTEQ